MLYTSPILNGIIEAVYAQSHILKKRVSEILISKSVYEKLSEELKLNDRQIFEVLNTPLEIKQTNAGCHFACLLSYLEDGTNSLCVTEIPNDKIRKQRRNTL